MQRASHSIVIKNVINDNFIAIYQDAHIRLDAMMPPLFALMPLLSAVMPSLPAMMPP